ncbi:hypothetical protein VTN77DRAFT_9044 [Rasamsonia byssochlamydoides]|uniref:uncharacterized protein n=1 Tax=Rasamsonia byssochlamydoides TaxID=89139 RepID=UPI003742A23A
MNTIMERTVAVLAAYMHGPESSWILHLQSEPNPKHERRILLIQPPGVRLSPWQPYSNPGVVESSMVTCNNGVEARIPGRVLAAGAIPLGQKGRE